MSSVGSSASVGVDVGFGKDVSFVITAFFGRFFGDSLVANQTIELVGPRRGDGTLGKLRDRDREQPASEAERDLVSEDELSARPRGAAIHRHRALLAELFGECAPFQESGLLEEDVDPQGTTSTMARSRSPLT
jgi:hypothetical protein